MSIERKTIITIAVCILSIGLGLLVVVVTRWPVGFLIPGVAILAMKLTFRRLERPRPQRPPECPKCRYPLESFMHVCPECGHADGPIVVRLDQAKKT